MSTTLYSARIIEGPSPSQFAIAAAEGGVADFTFRFTLLSNGRLISGWGVIPASLADMDPIPRDNMYHIRGDGWAIWYDPFHCDGYVANTDELSVDSIT